MLLNYWVRTIFWVRTLRLFDLLPLHWVVVLIAPVNVKQILAIVFFGAKVAFVQSLFVVATQMIFKVRVCGETLLAEINWAFVWFIPSVYSEVNIEVALFVKNFATVLALELERDVGVLVS